MTLTASSYATTSDLSAYLPDVNVTAQSPIWTTLLSAASAFIEDKCNQYFYAAGIETKYFDGDGETEWDTNSNPFYGKGGLVAAANAGVTSLSYTLSYGPAPAIGDVFVVGTGQTQEKVTVSAVSGTGPYTLTVGATTYAHVATDTATTIQIQMGYYENDPVANWTPILDGNGHNPGSNFFLWPANRRVIRAAADNTAKRPWYGVNIARIPVSGTTYLPASIPGYRTLSITANWGWPQVPDAIKDLTCKMAVRAWHARDVGWTAEIGNPETGLVKELMRLDPVDEYTLIASDYVNTYL